MILCEELKNVVGVPVSPPRFIHTIQKDELLTCFSGCDTGGRECVQGG